MFHFLGFLFIIIIAILLIGLSIIGTVIRSIFGLGSRRSSNTYRNDNGNYQSGRGYSFNGRQQSGSSSNEASCPVSEQLFYSPYAEGFIDVKSHYRAHKRSKKCYVILLHRKLQCIPEIKA